ncbi:ABC transporter permease [Clostridium sp.]|uniref:ABC transporter permease n=1 Tax=Clostridium sp. TaxID=1506 RepID=UPI00290FE406|nr:ABC transporter permease [Clostridium sp.]MDU5106393.1 ABC transporter permease [Clostridium sp.]
MNLLKDIRKQQIFWPLVALLLVLLFNLFFTPGFFKIEMKDGHLFGSLIDIINRGAPLMILSIGLTLVIATSGTDISVGSVIAITAAIVASLIGGEMSFVDGVQEYVSLIPMPIAIIVGLLVACLLGFWNGVLIGKIGIQPIIATMILMVAGRGIAQLITKAQIITIYYKPYFFFGGGYLFGLPFSIYIVALCLLAIMLIVKKTAFGLFVESSGCNSEASKYVGIKVHWIKVCVYTISGLCAGIAAILLSSNIKCADANNLGLYIELDAILAVAIGGNPMSGGKFSIPCSMVGALIIQSLTTTIYSFGVPPEVTLVVKALVVIVICLLQSENFRVIFRNFFNKKRGVNSEKLATVEKQNITN